MGAKISEKLLPKKSIKNTVLSARLKDGPHLCTGGGEKMQIFFFTQNAKSRDRSVVAGSNLFWHTLWTLPALFGARTPPKSMCTQRHTPSEISTKKMQILGLS